MEPSGIDYFEEYRKIQARLKKKGRFQLGSTDYAGPRDAFTQLSGTLKRNGNNIYSAFAMFAAARCEQALGSPMKEANTYVETGRLIWQNEVETSVVFGSEFEEYLTEAVHCYLMAIEVYFSERRHVLAANLYYEMASFLTVLKKTDDAVHYYMLAADAYSVSTISPPHTHQQWLDAKGLKKPPTSGGAQPSTTTTTVQPTQTATGAQPQISTSTSTSTFQPNTNISTPPLFDPNSSQPVKSERPKHAFSQWACLQKAADILIEKRSMEMAAKVLSRIATLSRDVPSPSTACGDDTSAQGGGLFPLTLSATVHLESKISLLLLLLIQKLRSKAQVLLEEIKCDSAASSGQSSTPGHSHSHPSSGGPKRSVSRGLQNESYAHTQSQWLSDIVPLLDYLVAACKEDDVSSIRELEVELSYFLTRAQVGLVEVLRLAYENPLFMQSFLSQSATATTPSETL